MNADERKCARTKLAVLLVAWSVFRPYCNGIGMRGSAGAGRL